MLFWDQQHLNTDTFSNHRVKLKHWFACSEISVELVVCLIFSPAENIIKSPTETGLLPSRKRNHEALLFPFLVWIWNQNFAKWWFHFCFQINLNDSFCGLFLENLKFSVRKKKTGTGVKNVLVEWTHEWYLMGQKVSWSSDGELVYFLQKQVEIFRCPFMCLSTRRLPKTHRVVII